MPQLVPPPPLADDIALFLDFDGTLALLQDDRDDVWLDARVSAVLERINSRLNGRVVIISGRAIGDLARRTPANLMRIGGHGLHILAPGDDRDFAHLAPAPELLVARLRSAAAQYRGVTLEEKGEVLALHYRTRPDLAAMLVEIVRAAVAESDGYVFQHGKFVIEAKPARANKGRALAALMKTPPFTRFVPVMIGDDATDEDAFTAAQVLGGIGVKVGPEPTAAWHRLEDVMAVHHWLAQGAGA